MSTRSPSDRPGHGTSPGGRSLAARRRGAAVLLAAAACAGALGAGSPSAAAAAPPAPPAAPGPSISLTMSPLAVSFASAGIRVFFHYTITNTGGQTLTEVTVRNSVSSQGVNCVQRTLGPGQATDCFDAHTTTAADVAAGGVTNTATATGLPPTGTVVTSAPVSATVPARAAPALALIKNNYLVGTYEAGRAIPYLYGVENTGNVTLTGIAVHDPQPGLTGLRCQGTTVAPGELIPCFAAYTPTAADVAAGHITDTATASAVAPDTATITSNTATWTIYGPQPWLSITKTVSPATYTAGTRLRFTYTYANAGNTPLAKVTVTDTLPGLAPNDCPVLDIYISDSWTCSATYIATAADVRAGSITNSATVSGTTLTGPPTPVTAGPATATAFAGGSVTPPNQGRPIFLPLPYPFPLGR
ncbi:conserved repeat domain protein [Pseudofrankia inefficax]|uniref:Conserved repeat domain protein n=1 Tax=Pseudofrankia inefficax (strain DSM 45817 / CECT 9037 / DDB 130130 / EuI1c) TaxID=298654 RepID=E3J811_PSEI1|nr:conserved repeat domain protein [Pseudofrankia inefficax]